VEVRVGVVTVPGAAGGFFLGGVIVKKLSLQTGQQLRAVFFLAIISLVTMTMYLIQCDTAPLADIPPHDYSPLITT